DDLAADSVVEPLVDLSLGQRHWTVSLGGGCAPSSSSALIRTRTSRAFSVTGVSSRNRRGSGWTSGSCRATNTSRTRSTTCSTARAIAERTGGRVRGFGQRGTGAWHTMYTGFATQFWSYGASDFEAGRCALAAPAAVEATADFLDALRVAGPSDWPEQRWYE